MAAYNPEYANSRRTCPRCSSHNSLESQFCGHCGKSFGTPECQSCGNTNSESDDYCTACGAALSSHPTAVTVQAYVPQQPVNNWGYGCAIGALFIFPPLLGLIAFVIGAINLSRGHTGAGLGQMLLAGICTLIGIALGVASVL